MASYNSQWNKLGIADRFISDTTKLFFGKYSYRVNISAPGAHKIRDIKRSKSNVRLTEFKKQIEYAKNLARHSSNIWSRASRNRIEYADATQLWTLYEICKQYEGKIRTRCELGSFQIYTETEEQLRDILLYSKKHISSQVKEITRPANEHSKTLLLEDKVILVDNPKHKFKVTVREHRCTDETRKQILSYLSNLSHSDITLINSLEQRLKWKSMTGHVTVSGYFYANNLATITFLQMIAPKFVNKIYRLEQS